MQKSEKLRTKTRTFIVTGLILLMLCMYTQAVPITIEITGHVTSASGTALPGSIYEGVGFTGSYTYNSLTSDSDADTQWGEYLHDSPYGIRISMGGYEFKTASSHVEQFKMQIGNDKLSNGINDEYWVQSQYENTSVPSLGFNISYISWRLSDSTLDHDALSSDALPITAPELTDWNHNKLYISDSGIDPGSLTIRGTVTQTLLIPEPVTCVFLITGAFILRGRRKTKALN